MVFPNDEYRRIANLRSRIIAVEQPEVSYIPPVQLMKIFDRSNNETSSPKDVKYILDKINIDAPLKIILGEITLAVKIFQRLKKNRKKFNIDILERDVAIYELRFSQGKKIREIAQEIYPDHFKIESGKEEDTAIREVKRSLARIKKLIKEGDI